jgi:hypothetical protein
LQLFGHVTDGLIEILRADRPSLGDHERLYFAFDQVVEDLVGDLHSRVAGNVLPSSSDLTAWSALRRSLGLELYVGIIAVRSGNHWTMLPWIVRQGIDDRDVAERAAFFARVITELPRKL